jgi:hypothetical protein
MVKVGHDGAHTPILPFGLGQLTFEYSEYLSLAPPTGQWITRGLLAQRGTSGQQFCLQLDDAPTGTQSNLQFMSLERLRSERLFKRNARFRRRVDPAS